MRRLARLGRWLGVFALVFVAPVLVSTGMWAFADRPANWRAADWGTSGLLAGEKPGEAVIHVLAARTGGLKGALAIHSWIVLRRAGESGYDRYDKVGWGSPIRRNGYAADGRWYSNDPEIVATVRGAEAERLIPLVEAAIASYPHAARGGYRLWPGPNSNSFVAHVLRSVPDIGAVLPPNAVGRDYLPGGKVVALDRDWRDLHVTLYGLAGFSAGLRSGLEVHLFGLVAGIDIIRPGVKLPGLGRLGIYRARVLARSHSVNWLSPISPAARPSIVVVASTSSAVSRQPFIRRKTKAARNAVRLLPSTNGWLRAMPNA